MNRTSGQRGVHAAAVAVAVVVAVAILTAAAPSPDEHATDRRSSGCRTTAVPAGVSVQTMTSGGVTRTYQLTVPEGYTGRRPYPVVLGLHALTVSYQFVSGMIGFSDMAKRYDFIGVAPSGLLNGATPFWLAAPTPDSYDVRFISDLLDVLESKLCIDRRRVYSTGMSNGAQMSSLLACMLPDRIAAVAPVAGVEFYDLCGGRPVPVVAFHGTADPIVTYDGGGLNSMTIANLEYWKGDVPSGLPAFHGVDAAMQTWAAHNGCAPTPREVRISPEVRRRTWTHCRADTVLYIIDGGGHAWPGKPVPAFEPMFGHGTTEIDASTVIFRFLFRQRIHAH
jgi:polyhydroxybutyrate depolymerase